MHWSLDLCLLRRGDPSFIIPRFITQMGVYVVVNGTVLSAPWQSLSHCAVGLSSPRRIFITFS